MAASSYDDIPDFGLLYDSVPLYAERNDVAFYVEEAKVARGTVLELGCGTGRILLPIARAGCTIAGLDSSREMLARCRQKLAAEPAKFQALVRALAKANRFMYANKARTVEVAVKHAKLPREVAEPAYDELVKGKVWAQNDGLPRAKVEYTIERMVKVGSIKPEERPKHEDYVAVSIVEEAMKRLSRVPDYD